MTHARTVLRRSSLIAVGALSSRVTGFVRTAAIGAALGAGLVGDAYATSIMLPGILGEILLGGVGTAILVPLLNRAKAEQPDVGREFAQRLLSFAVLAFAAAAVLATAAVPFLIPLLGGSATAGDNADLTTLLSMMTAPTVLFYGVGAVATAILNARGTFALPSWSPACNNLTLIAAATVLIAFPADDFGVHRAVFLGAATLLGAALQTAVLLPALRRAGVPWRWKPDLRGLGLRSLARTAMWVTVYVAAGQAAVLLIIGLTRAAAARGGPGPLIYNNAWVLLMMAYGVIALPVITALTPELSARTGPARDVIASTYRSGLRLLIALTVPVAAAMIVMGEPIAIVVFQWGEYTHTDAVATGTAVACTGLALVPYSISQLQFFAFLATGDARTPAWIMVVTTAARAALCLLAYVVLPAEYTVAAMMTVNAVTYTLVVMASAPILRRRTNTRMVFDRRAALQSAGVALAVIVVGLGSWWSIKILVSDEKIASVSAIAAFSLLVAAVAASRFRGRLGYAPDRQLR